MTPAGKNCLGFGAVFIDGVDKGQQLCHGNIDLLGDFLVDIKPCQHLHKIRVLFYGDIVLLSKVNDLLRNNPRSLGRNSGGGP